MPKTRDKRMTTYLLVSSTYSCRLFSFSVPGLSTAKGLGLAFQANDPYAKEFSLAILNLHEKSFLEDLRRKWWETTNVCDEERETSE